MQISSRKDLHFWLKEDAKRNGMDYGFIKLKCLVFCGIENACAYWYIRRLRLTEYYYNKGKLYKPLYIYSSIILHRLGLKYNIQIPINKTGYGLRIMHLSGGGGVLLNVKKVGIYCGFNSGVLLGNNGSEQLPEIGDYVAFGPGSSAFGDITIGNNCFIAPGAVVVKSFPPNCILGGMPAKILKYKTQ